MVLNELSLRSPAYDIPTARQWMSELIQTLREATKSGVQRVLRTSDEINLLILAPDYSIVRWRNDPEVDLEERRFFKTLTQKYPVWTDVAENIKDSFDLSDVFHEDERAKGLGFAFLIDGLAVSFQSESKWNSHHLELKIQRLDEEGELIDEIEEIKHASRVNHLFEHTEWIKQRIETNIKNGLDIWNRREELFPNLSFCECVEEQLQSLNDKHPMLQLVKSRLLKLENYCKNWSDGTFESNSLGKTSQESQITLQNPKYQNERTFLCPDGQDRLFSWHMKLSRWRIYFFPQSPRQKIIIGYIGLHLRTVKYYN